MNLQKFIASLDLLRMPEMIDKNNYPNYPIEDIIYLGYEHNHEKCWLQYCTIDEPMTAQSLDVTQQWEYLQALRIPSPDVSNRNVELLEGIWLFDVISTSHFSFLNLVVGTSIDVLYAMYTDNRLETSEAVLWSFNNNILLRDIAVAQIKYFIKRYISFSSYHSQAGLSKKDFNEKLKLAVIDYIKKTETCGRFKSEPITGKHNRELEDLIQQLAYEKTLIRSLPW